MKFFNGEIGVKESVEKERDVSIKEGLFFQSEVCVYDRMEKRNDNLLQCENIVRSSISEMEQLKNKYDVVLGNLEQNVRTRANELLLQFNQLVYKKHLNQKTSISVDRYTDESIIVRFQQREDVRVTLNFTEPDFIDDSHKIHNVEVAYLSYISDGKRRIRNSTLPVIVDELSRIL